jgi:3-methyladenine DNA glycosylase AlkD
MYNAVITDLKSHRNPLKAAFFPRFFKTGKGEYGEGDVFIGVTVPQIRAVAKKHRDLPLADMKKLLNDPIHEARLCALIILVNQYERGDAQNRKRIVKFYLKNLKGVNNWDLVDSSASQILGQYLLEHQEDLGILKRFADSADLWQQRIAIVSTHAFIRAHDLTHTFMIAETLLGNKHDLIHKAVGWMLREAGKRHAPSLKAFLKKHKNVMPRTMLRYAIEKFDEVTRASFLSKKRIKSTGKHAA